MLPPTDILRTTISLFFSEGLACCILLPIPSLMFGTRSRSVPMSIRCPRAEHGALEGRCIGITRTDDEEMEPDHEDFHR